MHHALHVLDAPVSNRKLKIAFSIASLVSLSVGPTYSRVRPSTSNPNSTVHSALVVVDSRVRPT